MQLRHRHLWTTGRGVSKAFRATGFQTDAQQFKPLSSLSREGKKMAFVRKNNCSRVRALPVLRGAVPYCFLTVAAELPSYSTSYDINDSAGR